MGFDFFKSGQESDLAGFRNSNLAGAGFEKNLFSDHRTNRVMKLTASTTLQAAVKRQYSPLFPLLCHFARFSFLTKLVQQQ